MAPFALWAIAGIVLIIAEMITGTFYLLVIGIAALIGALAAYLGAPFWLQAVLAAIAGIGGVYAVHNWWINHPKNAGAMASLDTGEAVVLESWVDEPAGRARVRYRGTTWDARVTGAATINETLYIRAQQSGVLDVSAKQ